MQISTRRPTQALVLLLLSVAEPAFASITIGSGSTFNFADGTFDFGCEDLTVAGQVTGTTGVLRSIANLTISSGGGVAPAAGSISLGGDFADSGNFAAGTSRVAVVDTCGNGTSRIAGTTSFYDLTVTTTGGKQLMFPAGVSQLVAHALTFQGAAGKLLNIVSSNPGVKALLKVSSSASQTIGYVNARDNDASGGATIAPGLPSQYNSIDSGGLINWFGASNGGGDGATLKPAPILDTAGRLSLLLGFLLTAFLAVRRKSN